MNKDPSENLEEQWSMFISSSNNPHNYSMENSTNRGIIRTQVPLKEFESLGSLLPTLI
jgi:hypothetical protein